MPTLRIFISSTYRDLLDYRQATSEAIRGLELHADDMELWAADERDTSTYSTDRVKQSDVLILLLAHRYGTIPPGGQHSVTEMEYRVAREAGIPVLAFLVDQEVPWPPQFIEWESRDRLEGFKKQVGREVTRKYFRSPQHLAVQVTQALAQLLSREPASRPGYKFVGAVRPVTTPSRLVSDPDLVVPIGTAEDDLPLVLEVTRSRDLSQPFNDIRLALLSDDRPPPDEMLETFQASLVDYATRSWASADLRTVRLLSGEDRRLYVTPYPLIEQFTSALAGFLNQPTAASFSSDRPTNAAHAAYTPPSSIPPYMQSTGGRNRFLGIDPENGDTYSVGVGEGGSVVEWRPFICENLTYLLPEATVVVQIPTMAPAECPVDQAADFLLKKLHSMETTPDGRIPAETMLTVSRQALLTAVVAVGDELAALHANGMVHGDVKPDNVLIDRDGIALIDSFDVPVGERAAGWTPNWSAPEQVRGEPATPAADLYPLAMMVVHALGGEIVGEVRKYRTPSGMSLPREVDLFHNPTLYIGQNTSAMSYRAVTAWRKVIERAVRFEPDQRPESVQRFTADLRELLVHYPVDGEAAMRPTGALLATRLVDGTEAVARVVPRTKVNGQRGYGGYNAYDSYGAYPNDYRLIPKTYPAY